MSTRKVIHLAAFAIALLQHGRMHNSVTTILFKKSMSTKEMSDAICHENHVIFWILYCGAGGPAGRPGDRTSSINFKIVSLLIHFPIFMTERKSNKSQHEKLMSSFMF